MSIKETIVIFDKNTRKNIIDKSTKVTVRIPNIGTVEGVLTNRFKGGSSANWETFMNINTPFKIIESALLIGNNPAFSSGIFTRRFYKGGSYITFDLNFRVTDWDGTGIVSESVNKLIKSTLPKPMTINSAFDTLYEEASAGITFVTESTKALAFGEGTLRETISEIGTKFEKTVNDFGSKGVQPVYVNIGNYFSGTLIVEDVSFEYSVENVSSNNNTSISPLYVDFVLKVSTQEVPDNNLQMSSTDGKGKSRISFKNGVSRVKIKGQ